MHQFVKIFWAVIMVSLLAFGISGCGGTNPHPPGSYERAMLFVEEENFAEAVTALETYIRHNPTDSLAAEAQYTKAMLYMDMGEYPLAGVEFQILRKDFPTSLRVEDAFFMEGVAYLRQVGRVQRDVTGAREARMQFQKFILEYPESSRRPEAMDYLESISDLMILKRLGQVQVYRQLGRYQAAALGLDDILAAESGSSLLDRVLWERSQTALKLEDNATARSCWTRLVTEFPDSQWRDKAASGLAKFPATAAPAQEE